MRPPARLIVCSGAIFVAGLAGLTTPSKAYIDHPWCTGGGGWAGALTCSFNSYEQCKANDAQLRGQSGDDATPPRWGGRRPVVAADSDQGAGANFLDSTAIPCTPPSHYALARPSKRTDR